MASIQWELLVWCKNPTTCICNTRSCHWENIGASTSLYLPPFIHQSIPNPLETSSLIPSPLHSSIIFHPWCPLRILTAWFIVYHILRISFNELFAPKMDTKYTNQDTTFELQSDAGLYVVSIKCDQTTHSSGEVLALKSLFCTPYKTSKP